MQRQERHEEWKAQYHESKHTLKPRLSCVMIYMYKCSWLEWWKEIEIDQLEIKERKIVMDFLCVMM